MDSIVLLSKIPGITSFSSLFNVKRALDTKKVGHTGTLDSFAQGLMVVCTGRYTRLCKYITESNKTYQAVISFGKETDTLEYTGNVVKTTDLPTLEKLKTSINKFMGESLQTPPKYSAIHVDGIRASQRVRQGLEVSLPQRPIVVYNAELKDYIMQEDRVKSCLINFTVSKGTYIRCLARDIAIDCDSAGYLTGLYRTKVGNFCVEESAGFSLIKDFSIKNCLQEESEYWKNFNIEENTTLKNKTQTKEEDKIIQNEIKNKCILMNKNIAQECGFIPLSLQNIKYKKDFDFARPLKKSNFVDSSCIKNNENSNEEIIYAVFFEDSFCGLIEYKQNKFFYKFVNN